MCAIQVRRGNTCIPCCSSFKSIISLSSNLPSSIYIPDHPCIDLLDWQHIFLVSFGLRCANSAIWIWMCAYMGCFGCICGKGACIEATNGWWAAPKFHLKHTIPTHTQLVRQLPCTGCPHRQRPLKFDIADVCLSVFWVAVAAGSLDAGPCKQHKTPHQDEASLKKNICVHFTIYCWKKKSCFINTFLNWRHLRNHTVFGSCWLHGTKVHHMISHTGCTIHAGKNMAGKGRKTQLIILLCLMCLLSSYALENGCARLPPMGYNTWNDFGCANLTFASIKLVVNRYSHTLFGIWKTCCCCLCFASLMAAYSSRGLFDRHTNSISDLVEALI